MTEATQEADADTRATARAGRGERSRAETDRQIRTVARDLLVTRGRAAVTLRAIAREMGITAPALYRYYDSFEDLIRQVCADICTDLAAELGEALAALPEQDTPGRVFAVCRGFRFWAIRHPREFALVFATPATYPTPAAAGCVGNAEADPFGHIFLTVAGQVLITREVTVPPDAAVPEGLRADLVRFRGELLGGLTGTGLDIPAELVSLGVVYAMVRFWVRLYGQVALEVFGRFPFPVSDPEPLFESMLAELAGEFGLLP